MIKSDTDILTAAAVELGCEYVQCDCQKGIKVSDQPIREGITNQLIADNAILQARIAELEAEVKKLNRFRERLATKHRHLRDFYNEVLARAAMKKKES